MPRRAVEQERLSTLTSSGSRRSARGVHDFCLSNLRKRPLDKRVIGEGQECAKVNRKPEPSHRVVVKNAASSRAAEPVIERSRWVAGTTAICLVCPLSRAERRHWSRLGSREVHLRGNGDSARFGRSSVGQKAQRNRNVLAKRRRRSPGRRKRHRLATHAGRLGGWRNRAGASAPVL